MSADPEAKKPNAGDMVILVQLPPGFLDNLPSEDQTAIVSKVGKAVLLVGYDEDGRAELELEGDRRDRVLHTRSIWVHPSFIRPDR